MNTLVSFEIAKLLKEKGFEQKERPSYLLVPFRECTSLDIFGHDVDKLGFGDRIGYYIPYKTINAPTIAEVVMWLYEKHELWVYSLPIDNDMKLWQARVIKGEPFSNLSNTLKIISNSEISYRHIYSPKEAYEAGIIYTLKNLIK